MADTPPDADAVDATALDALIERLRTRRMPFTGDVPNFMQLPRENVMYLCDATNRLRRDLAAARDQIAALSALTDGDVLHRTLTENATLRAECERLNRLLKGTGYPMTDAKLPTREQVEAVRDGLRQQGIYAPLRDRVHELCDLALRVLDAPERELTASERATCRWCGGPVPRLVAGRDVPCLTNTALAGPSKRWCEMAEPAPVAAPVAGGALPFPMCGVICTSPLPCVVHGAPPPRADYAARVEAARVEALACLDVLDEAPTEEAHRGMVEAIDALAALARGAK